MDDDDDGELHAYRTVPRNTRNLDPSVDMSRRPGKGLRRVLRGLEMFE